MRLTKLLEHHQRQVNRKAWADLRQFCAALASSGQLTTVSHPVSPSLQMTALCHRSLVNNGPALLFENPKGSAIPVLGNLFGNEQRILAALELEKRQDLIDLGAESRETLEAVARTPCTALRSVRKKPTREECQQVLAVLKAHDVRYFFYIGGNDSAETAHILNEIAVAEDYDVQVALHTDGLNECLSVADTLAVLDGRTIQAVTMAGLSGGFLAGPALDEVTLDEASLRQAGTMLAAGGIIAPWAAKRLQALGVEVFPPGSQLDEIVACARRLTGTVSG